MLGPYDVGHRVVVRRRVGTRDGRPVFTDALGELLAVAEDSLTIATRRGRISIPRHEVVAGKRIPPRAVPRRAVRALELAADEAWPAPVRQPLGGWWLRAADGWTGRANSALPLDDPGMPIERAVEAVTRWYADRGAPALINTPLPLAAPVDAVLDAAGWRRNPTVLVQTARLADIPTAPSAAPSAAPLTAPPRSAGGSVALTDIPPSAAWLALAAGRKGDRPAAAEHLIAAGGQVPVRFAAGYDAGGDLVATARGTITGDGRWLGIMLVTVAPAARRRGWASRLAAALVRWATSAGATDAFLQVEEHNAPAVALYRGLGFTTHHTYTTRTAPPRDPHRS